ALERPAHAAVHALGVGAPGRDQTEQGPGRLRSRAFAAAAGLAIHVRGAGLAPAAVRVLAIGQPAHRAADGEAVHVLTHRRQAGEHGARAVHVVDAPAAEPRAFLLLLGVQVAQPASHRRMAALEAEGAEHLDHVPGDVRAGRVDHLTEVAEAQQRRQPRGVVLVKGGPTAVAAL